MTNKRFVFGKWEDNSNPMTVKDAEKICVEANKQRNKIAAYPLSEILSILERVRGKWLDPDYHFRKEALRLLPESTGFSYEMIQLGLDYLCATLNPELLNKKIETELGKLTKNNNSISHYPIGAILHVLSGNVFLVALGSIIEGLLTGNVTILKLSSSETVFTPLFIQSILECDIEGVVSNSIAAVTYSSSQSDVIAEFKNRVDGIVVWGGEEAIRAYRDALPARTKLIIFGPKLSLSVVTGKGLKLWGGELVAERLAKEISIWDQNACTAPQVCYVESKENALKLTELLAASLDKESKVLPPGELDMDRGIEIRKLRTIFDIAEAKGEALLRGSKYDLSWTVVMDKDQSLTPSPLHRTIRVVPFTNIDEVLSNMEPLRGYVQTVGVMAAPDEEAVLSEQFASCGVIRIVELGEMAGGEIDDPHDGSYDLPQFVNFVINRFSSTSSDITTINQALQTLIRKARNSKFYSERFKGVVIENIDDLEKIPVLTREDMEKNVPPYGDGLSTGPYFGGYVSRSGGSTGEPKFSIYDAGDWEAMISHAVGVFYSLGIAKGDRLANCMMAGDLYGSFVSFDHINVRAGVTTFAFAGSLNPEFFLDVWRKFKINVIQGIPTTIVPFLRKIKDMDPSFTIEKVIYAGSPMSKSDSDWLMSALQAARVSSVIGANDGGQIAYQCSKLEGRMHHTADDFNYIEIVDENGRRVPDGEPGQILITSLFKYAFPLIRYAIGDQGRIIPEKCSCGRTARVLEYLGRSDDVICVGLLNLSYRDLCNALSEFPLSQIQIAAKNNERGEYLVVRLESINGGNGLKDKVYSKLLDKVEKLQERLTSGSLLAVEIEILPPGTIPRNPRSAKIKNIIDERI